VIGELAVATLVDPNAVEGASQGKHEERAGSGDAEVGADEVAWSFGLAERPDRGERDPGWV
jgi:hypothetical protein